MGAHLTIAVAASCCGILLPLGGGCEVQDQENLGKAVQPVWSGTGTVTDNANTFPWVVNVSLPGGACSGSLVARQWVLLASHCFDPPANANSNLTVTFGVNPGTPLRTFAHTFTVSGPALIRHPQPSPSSFEDTAEDVALFRLDTPVPSSFVQWHHITTSPNTCPGSNFTATDVGFGTTLPNNFPCGFQISQLRRYSTHDGWDRFGHTPGGAIAPGEALYNKTFINSPPPFFCFQYTGAVKGDSGGPLLGVLPGIPASPICGVDSNLDPPGPLDPLNPASLWVTSNHFAAADSPNNINWLTTTKIPLGQPMAGAGLIDSHGSFDGECPAYLASCSWPAGCNENDLDHDGVVDLCDNCKDVYNPTQTITDDTDPVNGFGAECNFCPGTQFSLKENRNAEAEVSFLYPGAGDRLPSLAGVQAPGQPTGVFAAPSNEQFEINRRLAWIKPDACDGTIVPAPEVVGSVGTLPPGALAQIVKWPTPGYNCPPLTSCSWEVDPNVIEVTPLRSDGGPTGTVTYGLRYCDCSGGTTGTPSERAWCQTMKSCVVDGTQYGSQGHPVPTSAWKEIITEASPMWGSTKSGDEFSATIDQSNDTAWNFIGPSPLVGNAFTQTGVLWSSIRSVNGALDDRTFTVGFGYTSGDESATLQTVSLLPHPILATPDWLVSRYCPTCQGYASRLIAVENDPAIYRATTGGLQAERGAPPALRNLYASVAAGDLRYVEAAEPLTLLSEFTPPGGTVLNGVALDHTLSVAKMFESVGIDALPNSLSRTPHSGTPELYGNEGMLLSAMGRGVVVIGGTTNGTVQGTPRDLAWILNIDTNLWTSYPLDSQKRPGDILGSTFRLQDYSVYVVDSSAHGKPHFRRWHPGDQVETLSSLPTAWTAYERAWLVAGPSGDMVFAATRSTGPAHKRTLFARFTFDSQNSPTCAGTRYFDETLLAAPIVGLEYLSLVAPHSSGGRLVTLPISSFVLDDEGGCPAFGGDDGGNEQYDAE